MVPGSGDEDDSPLRAITTSRGGESSSSPEPGTIHTIASYFREICGIRLLYPKMPCIHVGKGAWYPIEFLSQDYDNVQDAHDVKAVLGSLGLLDNEQVVLLPSDRDLLLTQDM